MKEYYVLSIKYSEGYVLTWWRPEASGYTIYLDSAGKFSEEEIKEHESYYNNRKVSVAIPCDVVDECAMRCVPWEGKQLAAMGVNELL